MGDKAFVVTNGFYETGGFGPFQRSWALGLEAAVDLGTKGMVDFTLNQYDNPLVGPSALVSRWSRGLLDLDAETGYSY